MSTASSPSSSPAVRRRSSAADRGFLLVVLASLCWGTAGLSGRVVADRSGLSALDIAWYRLAIGAVALLAAWAVGGRRCGPAVRVTRPVAVRLVLIGAGLAAYQLAFFSAVALAGVSIATLVALGVAPLLVAVGGALLGHGRPSRATLLVLGVALVGLTLLVGVSAGADTGTTVLLGALTATGSALGYAVVTLSGGGVPAGTPVTLVGFVLGALLLTPVVLAEGLTVPTDGVALAVLLYLGLVPSALAYGLFFTGVRSVPGAVVSIVTLLEPLTATVLATVFLGERLAPAAAAGGLLLLAAVSGLYLRELGGRGRGRAVEATGA
ncbi:DME family drug/metabolite transporter [Geodermatophilus tzadiensis]|uniref:DME family drug/metabolite transporter n=1 Tax=Geodermatophilus tzadiensis TaxID=1137988 RepID=A0A2T0TRC2_9ACTN|nr:EamA family transporter [Geodermatophilus tzadiensis]PRY48199.1 DME family drug/metabolite transporter [Geodermatophilus tzadiensis]